MSARNTGSLLLLATNFPPASGGISRYMHLLCCALDPARVGVVAPRAQGDSRRDAYDAFPIRRIASRSAGEGEGAGRLRWLAPAYLWSLPVRARPSVVVCDQIHQATIIPALAYRLLTGVPFVVFAHGADVRRAESKRCGLLLRIALRRGALVLANSVYTAEMVARLGIPSGRIKVIHPPVDPARCRPRIRAPRVRDRLAIADGPILLSVGRLIPRKGFDMVIRALPAVIRRIASIRYIVAGAGPDRARLEGLARDIGVEKYVQFLGHVDDSELQELFAASDAFTMVSREEPRTGDVEGFGMVFIEAALHAKPVVAGRSGGIPDAVVDGVTGLLVDPLDEIAIAEALVEVLVNRERAVSLGRRAQARALASFTSTHVADEVTRVLLDAGLVSTSLVAAEAPGRDVEEPFVRRGSASSPGRPAGVEGTP